jgi:4-hydroxybenzoate polyprenyltransferase
MSARLKAWLAISRCSNLPTVWSNILVGWIAGLVSTYLNTVVAGNQSSLPNPWSMGLWILLLGATCSYVGGMILNDLCDREWDALHRPERPIPSQLIHPRTAATAASVLLSLGFVFAISIAPAVTRWETVLVSALLVAGIVVYNRWHKGVWFAPLIMGLCRVALPLLGFLCATPSSGGTPHGFSVYLATLGVFTFLITGVARHEATHSSPSRWFEALFFLVPIPLCLGFSLSRSAVFVFAVYGFWILYSNLKHPLPRGVGARVSSRLAAIPLLDGLFLALLFPHYHAQIERSENYALFMQLGFGFFIPSFCFLLALTWRRWIPST